MAITHTNRKGITYHLCRTQTKSGAERVAFARQPIGEPVDEIPPGFVVRESVNGIVSLVKDRPSRFSPEEMAAVEHEIQRHPQAQRYRVGVRQDRIEVYEQVGPDATELAGALGLGDFALPGPVQRLQEVLDRHARYEPVLRFSLIDGADRSFQVERRCYLGSLPDWIYVGPYGPISQVAQSAIPRLGTDEFFELW